MTQDEAHSQLRRYAAGELGTRQTIEAIGGTDYADLIIALTRAGLDFPRPQETPAREAQVARARALLQPLLRRHAA